MDCMGTIFLLSMKQGIRFLLFLLLFVISSGVAIAQEVVPVYGKAYEGNVEGMVTLKFDFKTETKAVFTVSAFGETEKVVVTYEQEGKTITVHAQNGDMILTQGYGNVLTMDMSGTTVRLNCLTSGGGSEKVAGVKGHTFSGPLAGDGKLTLYFVSDDTVSVTISMNGDSQKDSWPYVQDGDTVTLTESMGRKIKLTLSENNQLKGMFTIFNVTLSMVN